MILRLLALVIVAVLLYNLFLIQVIEGEEWANAADNNRFRHLIDLAPRGRIFSADGVELAASVPSYVAALANEQNPALAEQAIEKLAEILAIDPEEIRQKLKKHPRKFEPVSIAKIDIETVHLLEEYRYLIPNLVIQVVPQRYYPENTLLAHTLGRVNEIDRQGVAGLEKAWDQYLRGEDGFSVIQVDVYNRPIGEAVNSLPAVPGKTIQLTIDTGLQKAVQASLQRVLESYRDAGNKYAWAGAAVVIDPKTGKILAAVSEPSFDNNYYDMKVWEENSPPDMPDWARRWADRTYNDRRTVGSAFKMVVGMAGLETGKITATEKIYAAGKTRINNQPVNDFGFIVNGNVDMRRALAVSSNIYFATVGARLGSEKIYEYIEKFGMSAQVKNAGFDDISPGEQIASLDYRYTPPNRVWVGGNTVQISYGQLNEFTPLQMANFVSMLANGGVHYKPYMVEQVTDYTGKLVKFIEPQVLAVNDFQPSNLKVIREGMLQSAARSSFLKNLPFAVAGKTGSAEHQFSSKKNPATWRDTHSWWVGYAPYDDPEIAIVVFMEYAGAGSRSIEVARDIIDYYFALDK